VSHGSFVHISLTPELERQVKLKVESGLYNNASEVVRESLRLLLERDAMFLRLKGRSCSGSSSLNVGMG